MTGKETRLARWSRLKARARRHGIKPDPQRQDPASPPAIPAVAAESPERPEAAEADRVETNEEAAGAETVDLEALARDHDLPSPETLDAGSDFSQFMRDDVPEILKRAALRRLWASDPVLANLDGLNDYDEDFTVIGAAAGAIGEGARKLADALKAEDGENAADSPLAAGDGGEGGTPERSPAQEDEDAIAQATADGAADEGPGRGSSSGGTES